MDDLLKASYYSLMKNKNYDNYQKISKVLIKIEDKLIMSHYLVPEEELINDINELADEKEIYQKILEDIKSRIIYRGGHGGN